MFLFEATFLFHEYYGLFSDNKGKRLLAYECQHDHL